MPYPSGRLGGLKYSNSVGYGNVHVSYFHFVKLEQHILTKGNPLALARRAMAMTGWSPGVLVGSDSFAELHNIEPIQSQGTDVLSTFVAISGCIRCGDDSHWMPQL